MKQNSKKTFKAETSGSKKTAGELTYLRLVSYGLIAGLNRKEIDRARPGEILDLFYYRQKYDASLGIRM